MPEPPLSANHDRTQTEQPEAQLRQLLVEDAPLTIAAAESCTGGEVAHRITAVPGSSAYFLGSIVTYSNDTKRTLLGVPSAILETRGAVSAECARAMAEGARRVFGADLAVATTGIAGPGGATPRKPVGLVYIALASPTGVTTEEHHFPGDRGDVVAAAAEAALQLLLNGVHALLGDRLAPDSHTGA